MGAKKQRALLVLIGVGLAGPSPVEAQFWDKLSNPKIQVTIKHPPGLGMQVKRIAFGPSKGRESDLLIDALTQDFVQSGVEVIDRQHLESILAEHNFSMSGYVDRTSAAELGKILGSAALIFVNLQRNKVEQQQLRDPSRYKDRNGNIHLKFISRTQAFLKASVQTVDLATGRIFQATTVEANPVRENETFDQCCAEYPPESEVQDLALGIAVMRIHQQFLPWSEVRDLYFFDDKDCDLKVAFSLLKGGDVEGAARQSSANLEKCKALEKSKDKTLAHAYYNLGMTRFLLDDHDGAIAQFGEAQRVKPMDITAETMAEATKARALAIALVKVEERVALEASVGAAGGRPVEKASRVAGTSRGQETARKDASAAGTTVEERLKKVEDLFRKKLISKVEYDRKRAEILKDM